MNAPKRLFQVDAYIAGICEEQDNSYLTVVDENFILEHYWLYFRNQLRAIGIAEENITKEACIDQWCVIYWAIEKVVETPVQLKLV